MKAAKRIIKQAALVTLIVMLLNACASTGLVALSTAALDRGDCVVLVHGLWRNGFAMRSIEKMLGEQGFYTVSIDYPSTSMPIPEISEQYLGAQGVDLCRANNSPRIHLVTHSMGGIVARHYLQTHHLPEGSRVVMLSPPNQGSEFSEKFAGQWWFDALVGPAGSSLTRTESGIIDQLEPISEPVGIVAAYRDWSAWPDSWLPAPNDGTVSVASMVLEEMDDFVLVNSGHSMMRYNDSVHQHIVNFLNEGRFDSDRVAGLATP